MSAPIAQTGPMPTLYDLRVRILTTLALAVASAAQRLRSVAAGQCQLDTPELRASLALLKLAPKVLGELPSDPDCDIKADYEPLPETPAPAVETQAVRPPVTPCDTSAQAESATPRPSAASAPDRPVPAAATPAKSSGSAPGKRVPQTATPSSPPPATSSKSEPVLVPPSQPLPPIPPHLIGVLRRGPAPR